VPGTSELFSNHQVKNSGGRLLCLPTVPNTSSRFASA